jgi:tellurite resistance protein
MRYSAILLLLLGLLFVRCDSDMDDNSDAECMELQNDLNEATNQMLATFEAYTKDTQDPVLCANYKEALENRIDKAQKMLDAACLTSGLASTTEQAIAEDQAKIDNLSC